jgi:hypothetical protein
MEPTGQGVKEKLWRTRKDKEMMKMDVDAKCWSILCMATIKRGKWVPVTTALRVLTLQMEKTAYTYGV